MPIEITRFDPEHASPLEGASGIGQVQVSQLNDARVTTLYFKPKGDLGRRELPYPVLLMILDGSGTLRLGGEIREVAAGDAILLPANTLHMIWTTDAPMTALTVDYDRDSSAAS